MSKCTLLYWWVFFTFHIKKRGIASQIIFFTNIGMCETKFGPKNYKTKIIFNFMSTSLMYGSEILTLDDKIRLSCWDEFLIAHGKLPVNGYEWWYKPPNKQTCIVRWLSYGLQHHESLIALMIDATRTSVTLVDYTVLQSKRQLLLDSPPHIQILLSPTMLIIWPSLTFYPGLW